MKTKNIAQVALRIPDELKHQVKDAAAREGRSMNAQIVQHLRTIYQPEESASA
ncbi:MAG: Arc family DNA-binding protein [Roseovarius sp.]|nr:Arc family DNA-binding protein [Roseovarius sp.]